MPGCRVTSQTRGQVGTWWGWYSAFTELSRDEVLTVLCVCSQFPTWKTSHTVKWEGVWRELGCLSRVASFAVRKESGHSLKSSLSVRALRLPSTCACPGAARPYALGESRLPLSGGTERVTVGAARTVARTGHCKYLDTASRPFFLSNIGGDGYGGNKGPPWCLSRKQAELTSIRASSSLRKQGWGRARSHPASRHALSP